MYLFTLAVSPVFNASKKALTFFSLMASSSEMVVAPLEIYVRRNGRAHGRGSGDDTGVGMRERTHREVNFTLVSHRGWVETPDKKAGLGLWCRN